MKKSIFAMLSICALAVNAADIGRVIVRQQWPWSTAINVEFELSGVSPSAPADVSFRCFNGAAEIPAATVEKAISGARYALTKGGTYTLTLDPAVLFPSGTKTVPDFRVTVAADNASEKSREVLYKIVNLESPYDVEDVTRARLLNGDMGAVETDYAALGAKYGATFSTSLEDVCIWTGVTNDVKYKSTHMVLRKIPANGKTFKFLKGLYAKPPGATSNQYLAGYDTSFTNDFYIGVFEVTQAQFKKMKFPAEGSFYETNASYSNYRPADGLYWGMDLRGTSNGYKWPDGDHLDLDDGKFFKKMQDLVGYVFDLPTEAMWEFACRGGTDTDFYSGASYSTENAIPIMRAKGVNCESYPSDWTKAQKQAADLNYGPNIVGSYAPNAYGLYDMLGNVAEWCLDRGDGVVQTGGVDPRGSTIEQVDNNTNYRVIKGGSFTGDPNRCGNRSRNHQTYRDDTTGFRVCLYPDFSL